ncbi:MAG: toxin-activating lysine-acyltransferase [Thermodesulfobacteriota bacterium]
MATKNTHKGKGEESQAAGVATAKAVAQPIKTEAAAETIVADKVAPPAEVVRQPSGPSEVLGDVTWLMTHSPAHKHLFLADLEWLALPPVMIRQFRLFKSGNRPFAFVSWAFLDEEAEKRLLSGQTRLRPGDWRSGDRLWLIDVVAPFGGADGVLAHLKQKIFPEQRLMALRPNPEGKGVVAGEVKVEAKKPEQAAA